MSGDLECNCIHSLLAMPMNLVHKKYDHMKQNQDILIGFLWQSQFSSNSY